jgi:uncharacterized protein YndB with AHSA1/START domain
MADLITAIIYRIIKQTTSMKHHPLLAIRLLVIVLVPILCFDRNQCYAQSLSAAEQALTKEKVLNLFIRIHAPLDSVWQRVSTEKGIKKFFAPACTFEPKVLSLFEIHFAPGAPAGQRGAENNRVLAIQEKQMISFTWDAPPQWPEIRKQRTVVALRLFKINDKETIVTLSQTGWGLGAEWNAVYDYFIGAWAGFVLPNLKYSLEVKPVDWTDYPKNAPQGLKPAEKF